MSTYLDTLPIEQRPLLIAIAGPNGAGKTTFYRAHLANLGLPYVNADDIAAALTLSAYEAAATAAEARSLRLSQRESFIFETVFSDPNGDKLAFLNRAVLDGYTVLLLFIGLDSPATSDARVFQRTLSGGHDVPTAKLLARYPRSLANLARAVQQLPYVLVYDNTDAPFAPLAAFSHGRVIERAAQTPPWAAFLFAPD